MTKLTIEFPDVLIARVADEEFRAKTGEVPHASLVKALEYGFQRIVNDKTGGKTDEEKHKIADATVARILDGTIASRVRASGVNHKVRVAREIMREIFKAKASAADKAAYKDADAEGRNAILDAKIEANAEAVSKLVDKEIARRKALRAESSEADIDI